MKRVVERCPNCGVEHDDPRGGPCEVCGTPLRFWCRVHGAQAGWLDAPVCPRCEAEAAAPPPPSRPRPAPASPTPPRRRRAAPVEAPAPRRSRVPPEPFPPAPGRDPRVVLREGAEDLRPYVATGAGVAFRLIRALLALVRNVILWGVLGALAGGVFAYSRGDDLVWTALFGAMIGGGAGLMFGMVAALRILFATRSRR